MKAAAKPPKASEAPVAAKPPGTDPQGRSHKKKVAAALAREALDAELLEGARLAEAVEAKDEEARNAHRRPIEFQIKGGDRVTRVLNLSERIKQTPASEPQKPVSSNMPPPPPDTDEEADEPPPPPSPSSGQEPLETAEELEALRRQEEEEAVDESQLAVIPRGDVETEALSWLRSLDGNKGTLLRYFTGFRDEFDCDFSQLAAARLDDPVAEGILGQIEPSIFDALGVEPIGHRLLLARGILSLAA